MKIKALQSLSFRLTIWYIVIMVGIIILAGFFLYERFQQVLVNDLDARLLDMADDVSESYYGSRGVTWADAIRNVEQEFQEYNPYLQVVELTDRETGEIKAVFASDKIPEGCYMLDTRTYFRANRADIDELVYQTVEKKKLSHRPLRLILLPVRGPYIVQAGISLEVIDVDLRRLLFIMILAGGLVLVLASAGGSFIIRQALQPVNSVAETARGISTEDLSMRIEARKRRDEIGELVDTFNAMIARLEKSVKKIKQFSGDVSHELRTPLTIIRGEVEVLLRKERTPKEYRKTLQSTLEETFHLERIIDDLLFLSRIEAMAGMEFQKSLDLDETLLRIVESRELAARGKDLKLKIDQVSPVKIKGDERLLERMIANLLDNAIRYTPEGREIEVSLERDEGNGILNIRDTGIGIPENAIPLIFDRFYVVDKSRSKETGGSGLGLSIVKRVADCHKARIEIQSTPGKGTLFRIIFQAEPEPDGTG